MRRAAALALALLALACSTPGATPDDAGTDAAEADAGVHGIHWAMGPPLPQPLAYATAQVFLVDTQNYLYVFGGSNASRGALGTSSSAVYRAPIAADGTLGAWQSAGDMMVGGATQELVGHGILPLHDAMGNHGVAIAGGGSTRTGALPIILAVYADPIDGHLFDWSRFPPLLSDGQSFGAFSPFDPFEFALVGGEIAGVPTARVLSASVRNDATATTWTVRPSLPRPRVRHASFVFALETYVLGGENSDGALPDVLRTTRDASDQVSGWEVVGTIDGPPVAHASFVYLRDAYLVGGIDGTTFDGTVSARVRRAPIDTDGHIGTFADEAEGLPMPLAASALANDYEHYFLCGGMTLPDLTATDAVIVGSIY